MNRQRRKTAPKVVDGKVQWKSRWAETPSYYNTPQEIPAIDRQRPGPGYRHLIKKKDLVSFISILPDWTELSVGLDVVVLAPGERGCHGWHQPGIVAICAWERELWHETSGEFVEEHQDLLDRLGVAVEKKQRDYICKFDEASARAFQFLHIMLHELGHHHDRMTTESQYEAARGEDYAEQYAKRYEKTIWHRYFEVFGMN